MLIELWIQRLPSPSATLKHLLEKAVEIADDTVSPCSSGVSDQTSIPTLTGKNNSYLDQDRCVITAASR